MDESQNLKAASALEAQPLSAESQKPVALAATPSAQQSAPLFGGLRGGTARKDGLVPGSPEAREADLDKDRERKRKKAAEKRGVPYAEPAPLPSAAPAGAVGAAPPQGGALPVDPVAGALAGVPWQASALKPVFEQLIPVAEDLAMLQIVGKCKLAKLPKEVIKDIETDARWHPMSKKGLEMGLPEVAAKYLNKAGVSAEFQPEVVLLTAISAIAAAHVRTLARLDKLIAGAPAADPAQKKP